MLIRLALILALVLHPAMLTGAAWRACMPSRVTPNTPAEAAAFPMCCAGMEDDADASSCLCASRTGVTGGLGCCCSASPVGDQQHMPQREQAPAPAPGDAARALVVHLMCDIRAPRLIDGAAPVSTRQAAPATPGVATGACERCALLCVWTT